VIGVWPRDTYVSGGGRAQVALIALSRAKLPDPLPVSRTAHGMPDVGDGPGAVGLAMRDRADNPDAFVEEVLAPFAELIAQDLGPSAAATALTVEHAYVIEAELDDPHDLGHLQAAWALAKCVCEEGAAIVIDVYAARAHLGVEVAALPPERTFDVMHEVTLGLRKFGRPDLVLVGIQPDDATTAAILLRDIAQTLAAGERIEPGDKVGTPDGKVLTAERFEPADFPLVAVDGEALLLR
jgi:hypothetical protein